MITVGIVSEYNPFHSGHLYQIKKVREIFGEDTAIVAVMSGNFVQRGEPAILDKWSRTRAAICCGVNLVIELPAVYATSSAELFADGGVAIAASTGICDYLVFGTESGNIDELDAIASVLADEPVEFRSLLRQHLEEGLSFSVSRSLALEKMHLLPNVSEVLSGSNNILAIEYLKAIKRRNIKTLKPYAILREGQAYNDISESGFYTDKNASASAIRELLQKPDIKLSYLVDTLCRAMPAESLAILINDFSNSNCIFSKEAFASEVFTHIIGTSADLLSELPGMNEGLGNRLKDIVSAGTSTDNRLSVLVADTSTKRYPRSRVRRALIQMILGIGKYDLQVAASEKSPYYIRVLGFDRKGRYLLKLMRKSALLPIISRGSDFKEFPTNPDNASLIRMSQIDINSTDIWSQKTTGECGRDFRIPPISFPQ